MRECSHTREIDPATGFAHDTYILPPPPLPPAEPPPRQPFFLIRHSYLGPTLGGFIAGVVAIILFLCKRGVVEPVDDLVLSIPTLIGREWGTTL